MIELWKMANRNICTKALNCHYRTAQFRNFKNFGHNTPEEPLYQKIYSTFIVFPFIFLPVNWRGLAENAWDFITFSPPRVPKYRDD